MAMLGPHFCARAFSSCGRWGPLFITVRRPLIIAASPVAEHRLQTRRLSDCGSRAQLLRGMWDPPSRGLEPVSPALAGRFSTTAPPGKPRISFYLISLIDYGKHVNYISSSGKEQSKEIPLPTPPSPALPLPSLLSLLLILLDVFFESTMYCF